MNTQQNKIFVTIKKNILKHSSIRSFVLLHITKGLKTNISRPFPFKHEIIVAQMRCGKSVSGGQLQPM